MSKPPRESEPTQTTEHTPKGRTLKKSEQPVQSPEANLSSAAAEKPPGLYAAEPKLKNGEPLLIPEKSAPIEVPDINTMHAEVILEKLQNQDITKREIAMFRKFFLEDKSPLQINSELQKEQGGQAGVDPQKIASIVEPIRMRIKREFGLEFPSYFEVNMARRTKVIVSENKNGQPYSNKILSAENRRLLGLLSEVAMSKRLKGVEADLFIAFWEENASLEDLAEILKKHNFHEAGTSLAQLKISIIVQDLLKEARRQEHEKKFPEHKDTKVIKGVKKMISAIARIFQ